MEAGDWGRGMGCGTFSGLMMSVQPSLKTSTQTLPHCAASNYPPCLFPLIHGSLENTLSLSCLFHLYQFSGKLSVGRT